MEMQYRHEKCGEKKGRRRGKRPWDYQEVKSTFVRLGRRIPAVLYEPREEQTESGEQPDRRIAVLVMHSDEDYLTFSTGPELAKRGIRTLCANVMNKEGILFTQNEKLECVKEAVEYLRSLNGIEKIILMGHSGGASLLSAYQCIAENGRDIFAGSEKLFPWQAQHDLPPADGIMFLDANWGNAVMQLFSLDRSIDLFNPENEFEPEGSTFGHEFIRRYQTAQGQRNMRLIAAAQERLEKIKAGEGQYDDDEPFIIPGGSKISFGENIPLLLRHPHGRRLRV